MNFTKPFLQHQKAVISLQNWMEKSLVEVEFTRRKTYPKGYAELVKIYLKSEYRGKGIGKQLMDRSIVYAKAKGYTHLYLESFPSLKEAIVLYEKIGFERVESPLGDSGHFACDVWMMLTL